MIHFNPVLMARAHAHQFTADFLAYLPENLHVYEAFEREALRIAQRGHRHYSARTIVEVLRHHSALQESSGAWKLNDHNTPYLARLFALMHPGHASLFEFRVAKAAKRGPVIDLGRYAGTYGGYTR